MQIMLSNLSNLQGDKLDLQGAEQLTDELCIVESFELII